jgi:hypothetical protein
MTISADHSENLSRSAATKTVRPTLGCVILQGYGLTLFIWEPNHMYTINLPIFSQT